MSQFRDEFETFFTSPAGINLLTWLQEQRTSMYITAESDPMNAGYAVSTAKAYGETLQHIDGVMTPMGKSPYSSRASKDASSTGLGTSQ
jgi:hypothetical protein